VATVSAPAARATYEILVQPGDTMQSISERAYGDANHVMAIARANHLSPAEQLVPGTLLLLPGDGAPLTALSSIIAVPARIGFGSPPSPPTPDPASAVA
jgi:LysM repeat protein